MLIERLKKWWVDRQAARRERLVPEVLIVVTTDGETVRATYPDGRVQAVRWNDLVRVVVETNDSGPWGADFWWILEGPHESCRYPQGATGEREAMDAFGARLE